MVKLNVLALTAGFGKRLRPWTERAAKPSLEMHELPLVFYPLLLMRHLRSIHALGFNTHHAPETMRRVFEIADFPFPTIESFEPELLGSGGGIPVAWSQFADNGDDLLVYNGDAIFLPSHEFWLEDFVQRSKHDSHSLVRLLLCPHPDAGTKFGAVWLNDQNEVCHIGKQDANKTTSLRPFHYVGIMHIRSSAKSSFPLGKFETFPNWILPRLQEDKGFVSTEIVEGDFLETGNIDDFQQSERQVFELMHPSHKKRFLEIKANVWRRDGHRSERP